MPCERYRGQPQDIDDPTRPYVDRCPPLGEHRPGHHSHISGLLSRGTLTRKHRRNPCPHLHQTSPNPKTPRQCRGSEPVLQYTQAIDRHSQHHQQTSPPHPKGTPSFLITRTKILLLIPHRRMVPDDRQPGRSVTPAATLGGAHRRGARRGDDQNRPGVDGFLRCAGKRCSGAEAARIELPEDPARLAARLRGAPRPSPWAHRQMVTRPRRDGRTA
jgi:hypothetical protein